VVVKAASGNGGCGEEVMELLLKRRGADVQITAEVVIATAGNGECGKKLMELLLARRGHEVQIPASTGPGGHGSYGQTSPGGIGYGQ
jgi:hypothetical protein